MANSARKSVKKLIWTWRPDIRVFYLESRLMAETLFHKVWNRHAVRTLSSGQTQLFVGLHLVHEVTSPQAFDMLRQLGWRVAYPNRTFATVDHIVPTLARRRPFLDLMAEEMTTALERNCQEFGIQLWAPESREQGIVHIIGPELGLTQPGMTIGCGDSHTSTHGAFGAIAFGIGTSQVRDVLASQCLALDPLKVRRIDVNGRLSEGVYAKDVILTIIRQLGVHGGVGYAYEYGGGAVDRMTVAGQQTVCNMSLEGGARPGHANRRRVHRVVHQRTSLGSRRGRACGAGPSCRAARQGARRTGLAGHQSRGGGAGAASGVHRRRLRVARCRLLDVPRHEHRPSRRTRDLRLVFQPQLQGTTGKPDRAHAAHEPRHGRRRRHRWRGDRCADDARRSAGVTIGRHT